MGQNSSEVAYGFGQMGSATCQTATPVIPPQGMVIVAIQFLADNTPTVLETEALGKHGPKFINTVSGANFEGVAQSQDAQSAASPTAGTAITITANADVKKGQYVLIVDDENTDSVGMGTAATSAGDGVDSTTPTPVYNGDNQQGVYVTDVNAAGTEVKLSATVTFDGGQHMVFLDNYHGAGGNDADGIVYPKGLTIYGRWTKIIPSASATGGIICYFGK